MWVLVNGHRYYKRVLAKDYRSVLSCLHMYNNIAFIFDINTAFIFEIIGQGKSPKRQASARGTLLKKGVLFLNT